MEKKLHNAFPTSHLVLELPEFNRLSHEAQLVYFWLSKYQNRYADMNGWFFRSMRDFKKDARMGQDTIYDCLDKLDNAGLIELQKEGKSTRIKLMPF
jgi:hypothetical protein